MKVEELKKKGKFMPEMSPEQLAEYTKIPEPTISPGPGAAGGAKADPKKKK